MSHTGPDMESSAAMSCGEAANTEFVLLVASAWRNRLPSVLAVLEGTGAKLAAVDQESAIVRGQAQAKCLEGLAKLPQVASLAWRQVDMV